MMTQPATVLLVALDPRLLEACRREIESEGGRLLVAADQVLAASYWEREQPCLVILGEGLSPASALELAGAMRSRPEPTDPFVVLVEGRAEATLRQAPVPAGVDEVLAGPLFASEVAARFRIAQRWREVREALAGAVSELARLRRALDPRRAEVVTLLLRLLESRLPGAGDRGARVAELAGRIAERFGVPADLATDLELAARLHEVGRLATEPGMSDGDQPAPWRYVLNSKAVLGELTGLHGAAELIGGIYENWDGSGFPDHLRQGQIPLRSRILRAVLDFVELGESGSADAVLSRMSERAGTAYDPLVLVHLAAVVEGLQASGGAARSATIPISELREGMVLAEDLYTESGVKLLKRGTVLTAAALDTIRRRHRFEPILRGAAVRVSS
jgi:response regulator RpfG family c-di-GMP phosphodiesterase